MTDATLAQGNVLIERILRERDSRVFLQNLLANFGAVQRIGRGEATQAQIIEALRHIQNTENPYATEKVTPTFFYPPGYKPNTVEEQEILLGLYDWLDTSPVEALAARWGDNAQADGLCVIPKPSVLAAGLGIDDPWTNFGMLTERGPLAALSSQRKLYNCRAGQMGANRYRLAESAKAALQRLEAEQPGDLLVFPAQSGSLYAGFSPRNARWEAEHAGNQWPLPSYVVGWMIFCNPHRLQKREDLIIDCPGDEYRFGRGDGWGSILYFSVNDEGLCLGDGWSGTPGSSCGSGSGFLQQ